MAVFVPESWSAVSIMANCIHPELGRYSRPGGCFRRSRRVGSGIANSTARTATWARSAGSTLSWSRDEHSPFNPLGDSAAHQGHESFFKFCPQSDTAVGGAVEDVLLTDPNGETE